jgi:two-component system response regulator VanR
MNSNILIVDDEKEIADLVQVYLTNEGYTVYKFYTATEALDCVNKTKLDLAILDIMLPDMDGFTLCRKIRENYTFPVIMLTAKDGEIDKISGLALGADDYMTKPFRPLELIARVKAQLRRYTKYNAVNSEQEENIISFSGLFIEKDTHIMSATIAIKP